MQFKREILEPGDALLYRPSSLMGWAIAVKTWTRISHVEVYAGDGMSVASRDGLGVNSYALRTAGLGYVLRPQVAFNFGKAMNWFQTVRGQKYDWKGLLCFTLAVAQGATDRMFCSEFATNFYRAGNFKMIADWVEADRVAPSEFLQSVAFDEVWSDAR